MFEDESRYNFARIGVIDFACISTFIYAVSRARNQM